MRIKANPPISPEGVKKIGLGLFLSFRRKPESSFFNQLKIFWTRFSPG